MLSSVHSPYRRYRLTVDDYHRMGGAGIFAEDERVELIEGEIIEMAPIGSQHAAYVARLQKLLERSAGDQAIIWIQNPVVLRTRTRYLFTPASKGFLRIGPPASRRRTADHRSRRYLLGLRSRP